MEKNTTQSPTQTKQPNDSMTERRQERGQTQEDIGTTDATYVKVEAAGPNPGHRVVLCGLKSDSKTF